MPIKFKIDTTIADAPVLEVSIPNAEYYRLSSEKERAAAFQSDFAAAYQAFSSSAADHIASVRSIRVNDYYPFIGYDAKPIMQALLTAGVRAPMQFFQNQGGQLCEPRVTRDAAQILWQERLQDPKDAEHKEARNFPQNKFAEVWLEEYSQAITETKTETLDYTRPGKPDSFLLRQCMGSNFFAAFLDYLWKLSYDPGEVRNNLSFTRFVYGHPLQPNSDFAQDLKALAKCTYFPFNLVLPQHHYSEDEFKSLLSIIETAYQKGIYQMDLGGSRFNQQQLDRILAVLKKFADKGESFCVLSGLQSAIPAENKTDEKSAVTVPNAYTEITHLCMAQEKQAVMRFQAAPQAGDAKTEISKQHTILKIDLPPNCDLQNFLKTLQAKLKKAENVDIQTVHIKGFSGLADSVKPQFLQQLTVELGKHYKSKYLAISFDLSAEDQAAQLAVIKAYARDALLAIAKEDRAKHSQSAASEEKKLQGNTSGIDFEPYILDWLNKNYRRQDKYSHVLLYPLETWSAWPKTSMQELFLQQLMGNDFLAEFLAYLARLDGDKS